MSLGAGGVLRDMNSEIGAGGVLRDVNSEKCVAGGTQQAPPGLYHGHSPSRASL